MKPKPLLVAGIMSGTSADGIDVALCRISPILQKHRRGLKGALLRPKPGSPSCAVFADWGGKAGVGLFPTIESAQRANQFVIRPRIELLRHRAFPYPAALRKAVLAAQDARNTSAAELARLNWRLGEAYADAAQSTAQGYALDLVGCHGQTIYHQGTAQLYVGRRFACTWQLGEPALIAAAVHAPVASNFRPADMVAGGQGAPLVPLLDATLFAHSTRARVLQNLGGIANLTLVPPGGSLDQLLAFDTGPANMVIDALAQRIFHKAYDRDGRLAAAGTPNQAVVATLLRDPYYRRRPPKSAGREQYGEAFVDRFLALARRHRLAAHDILATATALTSQTIALAYKLFVAPRVRNAPVDYIVAGGGARNATLMRMLAKDLEPFGCRIQTTDDHGIPSEAKEALAFALLAWHTWHRLPGNIPAATGASHPAILGSVTYV